MAVSSSQLPSFDEIFSTFCPTLKHIPFHNCQSFGRVFLECLLSILHDGSSHSWQRFLMLPKCVLASSKRGGRHHKHIHQSASCVIFGRQVKKFNYEIEQRGMRLNQVSRAFPHLNISRSSCHTSSLWLKRAFMVMLVGCCVPMALPLTLARPGRL